MAIVKKTTTKKPTVKSAIPEITPVKEDKVTTVLPKEKKSFSASDGIMCKSITGGTVIMIGIKSKITYTWESYGDETEVEYDDLVAAIRSNKDQILKPWIIVLDEDFIALYPKLNQLYEKVLSVDELYDVFNMNNEKFRKFISDIPSGVRESIKSLAADMIRTGKLDSVSKIKIMDEVFGSELALLADL